MERIFIKIFIGFFIVLGFQQTQANSCCGQSPASFTVLALEQKLSVNTTYSAIESQGRVFNSDEFYIWEQKTRRIQSMQLNVAGTWQSRHQYFLSSSYLQSEYKDNFSSGNASHLSDTVLGYTYEALPEYSYSPLRPLIYLTLMANLPTGKSIYDTSTLNEGTDVTGHHQWGLGAGLTLRKVYFPVTLTLQARSLYLFAKKFSQIEVSGFFDSSLSALANYATRFYDVSINTGFTFNHLSPRTISPGETSLSSQNITFIMGLQKPLNEAWNVGLNYTDQTLIGPAKNSILNKTISLNFNYNYY